MKSPNERERFPRTAEAFSSLTEGAAMFERLTAMEASFADLRARPRVVHSRRTLGRGSDFDVVLAGGGLSLLHAVALAKGGLRVAVVDRARIGVGHRGWNASRAELSALEGLFSRDEVEALVLARYERGVCFWHGGGSYPVRGVLDCSVDAASLLRALRARCEALGVQLFEERTVESLELAKDGVVVTARSARGEHEEIRARLLLDALGVASPFAEHDLFCPTVGGAIEGLERGEARDQWQPHVGEILATTEGVEEGRQHVWEGFPEGGERDALTVYLFHYAERNELDDAPLRGLFERFFRTRPRYKRGVGTLLRPTFGIIPGHSRLRTTHVSPHDRVLLVGDAAARHSPLTFCGFGSMLRSFGPIAEKVSLALAHDRLDRAALEATTVEPKMLRLLGALALMLTARGARAVDGRVCLLLDDAFAALAASGEARFAAFLRDEAAPIDVVRLLGRISLRRPAVYREVVRALGPRELSRWGLNLASSW